MVKTFWLYSMLYIIYGFSEVIFLCKSFYNFLQKQTMI